MPQLTPQCITAPVLFRKRALIVYNYFMPEMPEVETIVQGLNKKIRNRKILDIWTDWPKYSFLRKYVVGKKIIDVSRRGKNVLIHLSDNHLLLVHQKISGHLLVGKWVKFSNLSTFKVDSLPEGWQKQKWVPVATKSSPLWDPMNRFIRLIFFLDNGKMLALSDLRRFAKVLCGPKEIIYNLPDLKNLGPEPLDKNFSFKKLKELFKGKKGKVKQILMDQNFISGIGNIYSDEILWLAKIHPLRRLEQLKEKELQALYKAMRAVLQKALQLKGTSIDDYRTASGERGRYDLVRYVYQREDELCSRCKTKIKRIKIGTRSAHYCPKCQRI